MNSEDRGGDQFVVRMPVVGCQQALCGDPATIAKAKEEFLRKRGGAEFKYTTIVPTRPPFDYRKGS